MSDDYIENHWREYLEFDDGDPDLRNDEVRKLFAEAFEERLKEKISKEYKEIVDNLIRNEELMTKEI